MKCTKANEFITYSKDTSIYGFCDASQALHMFKCPNSQVFDKKSMGCKFECTKQGYFAGITSQDAYFCYLDGYTYKYVSVSCPAGYEFNTSFQCMRSATTVATTEATTVTSTTPLPTPEVITDSSSDSTTDSTTTETTLGAF